MLLDEPALRALAPEQLPTRRVARYEGDDMSVRMADLPAEDQARVRLLYDALSRLLGELRQALRLPAGDGRAPGGFSNGSPDVEDADADQVDAARRVLKRTGADPEWRRAVDATRALRGDEATKQALHDIRGGALTALSLTLQLLALRDISTGDVVRSFYLTRDHLKIMRNALEDIDADARARDTAYRDHGTHLLFEKWAAATHRQAPDRAASVVVDSSYEGPVSRRCLEFSALDRVLYNLLNNAVRFTNDGEVGLQLRAIEGNLRFVVANAITAEQRASLTQAHGDSLGDLYLGGFTTGGEGVGLSICAAFVANAYGLSDVEEAIRDRYVGATMMDDVFVAWFHWPMP